jgi:phosphopantothenoylcysteine synthetase/decarboxylase
MSKRLIFLILSGPTKEYIDPVRFISNESSGKMGKALAEAALKKGCKVIFISGPVSEYPTNVKLIKITTALEMFKEVKLNLEKADIIIGAAAVADYRPSKVYKHKIKKDKLSKEIKLIRNPDIIGYCGRKKGEKVVCGFALETRTEIENAKKKLKEKCLDMIVVNRKESLGREVVEVRMIRKYDEKRKEGEGYNVKMEGRKEEIGREIIKEVVKMYRGKEKKKG